MKLRISLVLFLFAGLLALVPVATSAHRPPALEINNRAQKCIITLRDKNSRVNVRTRPNLNARIVGRLRDGVYVNVTKHSQGWVYINGSDQGRIKGWLPEIYISC